MKKAIFIVANNGPTDRQVTTLYFGALLAPAIFQRPCVSCFQTGARPSLRVVLPDIMKPNGLKHLMKCVTRTAGSQRSSSSLDFRRQTNRLRHTQSIFSIHRPSRAPSIEEISTTGSCAETARQKPQQDGFYIVSQTKSSRPALWELATSQRRSMASEPSTKKELGRRFRLWTDSEGP
jgi:hypothetical protein